MDYWRLIASQTNHVLMLKDIEMIQINFMNNSDSIVPIKVLHTIHQDARNMEIQCDNSKHGRYIRYDVCI